ncbi:MAG: hypothetical protein ACWGKN_10240 [Desulfoprunum sp.]
MIIVRVTQDSEAGVMPDEALPAEMAAYHEELAKAGADRDGEIEVRRMFELEDFNPSEEVGRFRRIGIGTAK